MTSVLKGAGPLPTGAVVSIGVDLVSASEMGEAAGRQDGAYLSAMFTLEELEWCHRAADPGPRLAAVRAAKRAALKALLVDQAGLPWTDVHAEREPDGHWRLQLSGGAAELAARRGIGAFAVHVTQDGDFATATVIATRPHNQPTVNW